MWLRNIWMVPKATEYIRWRKIFLATELGRVSPCNRLMPQISNRKRVPVNCKKSNHFSNPTWHGVWKEKNTTTFRPQNSTIFVSFHQIVKSYFVSGNWKGLEFCPLLIVLIDEVGWKLTFHYPIIFQITITFQHETTCKVECPNRPAWKFGHWKWTLRWKLPSPIIFFEKAV